MAKRENAVVAREARDRSDAELKSLLNAKTEELQKLKFKHNVGQLRQTHSLPELRRDIARLRTVIAERSKAS